jgi:pyruvate/2-oxoglutarate dehydrogenase complex dihydrolipoamide dehydrogenase (E3) component
MSPHAPDLLVIGGGPAGVTAALRARELGASVALVERGPFGGTCTNDGCVPTRVLAHAARLVRDAGQYERFGLRGEPPVVDFPRLLRRVRQVVEHMHEKKQLRAHLEAMEIAVFDGRGAARFVDSHTVALDDGSRLSAERIIIAAGGHARRLDLPGVELALTHSDVWNLSRLPRSIAIVGGAATGCQLASIFAAFGTRVHLIEVGPRLLGGEDEDISATIAQAFAARGIQMTTSIGGLERIERLDSGELRLSYRQDSELRATEAEAVLLAVGWPANLEGLGLEAAGIAVERGHIRTDDALRTSVPHIFAAGDITGRMMLVQSAAAEGALAAENAVLAGADPGRHRIVPHGGFTDPEYGSVGLSEAQARAAGDYVAASVPYAQIDRALIDDHTEGFCKLIVSVETHHLLGAQVVGEQAVEVLQLIAAGMSAGIHIEQLADLELAYPTYAAIVGLAARQIIRELGVVPVAAPWRSLAAHGLAEWERRDA